MKKGGPVFDGPPWRENGVRGRTPSMDYAASVTLTLRAQTWLVTLMSSVQSKEGCIAEPFVELALYLEKVAGVRCRCSIPSDADLRDSQTAIQLLRIAQEALQNALRHGHAGEIDLSFERLADGKRVFKVVDNGSGFSSQSSGGTGIRNMKERARLIGGDLKVTSKPGSGTVVTCVLPASTA